MERESFEHSLPRKIETTDIEPILPEVGGTNIVLQRHGKYERSVDSPNIGSLTEEGKAEIKDAADGYFARLLDATPENERANLSFLVLGSDTQYEGGGRRSMETANQVILSLKEELAKRNLPESLLLNTSGNTKGEGNARPHPYLREPQMFEQWPEFVEFLKNKYGDRNLEFWIAFEEDKEQETRQQMDAEGPDDIADRLKHAVEILQRYSQFYHKKHPNKRLVIWAATHYDTISPYVKREIVKTTKETPLGVDYGAGVSINLDSEGRGKVKVSGQDYDLGKEAL